MRTFNTISFSAHTFLCTHSLSHVCTHSLTRKHTLNYLTYITRFFPHRRTHVSHFLAFFSHPFFLAHMNSLSPHPPSGDKFFTCTGTHYTLLSLSLTHASTHFTFFALSHRHVHFQFLTFTFHRKYSIQQLRRICYHLPIK